MKNIYVVYVDNYDGERSINVLATLGLFGGFRGIYRYLQLTPFSIRNRGITRREHKLLGAIMTGRNVESNRGNEEALIEPRYSRHLNSSRARSWKMCPGCKSADIHTHIDTYTYTDARGNTRVARAIEHFDTNEESSSTSTGAFRKPLNRRRSRAPPTAANTRGYLSPRFRAFREQRCVGRLLFYVSRINLCTPTAQLQRSCYKYRSD